MTQEPSRLDRLEALLTSMGDVVLAHDESLTRIETAIANLTSRVDALTTSTNQALTLASENNLRIREILEYLYAERPNGRGNGDIG